MPFQKKSLAQDASRWHSLAMPGHSAILAIDLSALRDNYRLLKNRHAKKSIAAVVKADAYGLGLGAIAQALWEEGCRDFFVAHLEEAVELREHLPSAAIAVFHGPGKGEEKIYQERHITPVINTLEQAEKFSGGSQRVVVHVDTGMTRLGLNESELSKFPSQVIHRCELLMSHLACANEPEHPKNTEQLARFKKALTFFPGVRASLCNSSGLFLGPEFHFDMGRPGCALYGITPVNDKNPMRPVATLSAPLLQIRQLDRDETVGYGAAYNARRGSRIAIVELGYADGVLRCLTNKGAAYIAGAKVPFVGRVSMDMIALDVSNIPESKLAGARAEFINDKQTVNDVAALASTIGYEIFTRIGKRVKRIYS